MTLLKIDIAKFECFEMKHPAVASGNGLESRAGNIVIVILHHGFVKLYEG